MSTPEPTPEPDVIAVIVPSYAADWSGWTRRVAAIVLLIALVYALTLLGPVLQSTILALILAFVLLYPIRLIAHYTRIPYALSVGIVFVAYLVVIAFLSITLAIPTATFIGNLITQGQITLTQAIQFLNTYTPDQCFLADPTTGQKIIDLNALCMPLSQLVKGQGVSQLTSAIPNVFGAVTSTAGTIGGIVSSLILINFLGLLFLLDVPVAFNWAINATPAAYRAEYVILMDRCARVWSNFFRGQMIVASLIGVLTWGQFAVMGIPGALTVGVFTAFVSLIPILGGVIALVPIGLVPLLQGSSVLPTMNTLELALIVLFVNLVIQQVIWNVVAPTITGNAVALPMPIIILGLFIGTAVGGVLGAFLAAPIMGIMRVLVEYVLRKIRGGDPYPGEPTPTFLTRGLFAKFRPVPPDGVGIAGYD